MTAGQLPDQPAVDRSEDDFTVLRALAQAGCRIEQPRDLRTREVSGQRQPAARLEAVLPTLARELADDAIGAHVLPVNGVVNRLAGVTFPQHGGLTLVGDAERLQIARLQLSVLECTIDHTQHVVPDLLGVMFHPPRARKDVMVLDLLDGDDARPAVEDEAPRGGGPLIDAGDEAHPEARSMSVVAKGVKE